MEGFKNPKKFGPYMLYGLAGRGGMAEVFLAISSKKEHQGQFIAVKKLHESLNANKAFVNLLIHEAKIGVLLNHPGIAQVLDLGSHQAEFFLAMEYVHGKSLDELFEKIKSAKAPPLDLELSTYLICEVLRALAFAHTLKDVKGRDLHIIHRDLSPGNILLDYTGAVKLTDFGIATAESRLQRQFTQSSLGKLAYMAPEQVVNDPVVKASDLYSLAVVYYELLSGQLPYQSESSTDLYRKIVDGKLVEIRYAKPEISSDLSSIIKKALDKSAKKRFRNAPEFFSSLQELFKKEKAIDFDSRTTRSYYRKKLSEYLKKHFESEILYEIQIIKKALQESEELTDLKSTAPIEIPSELQFDEMPDERTVFQPDVTDEMTRHQPMSTDDRERLMAELPPIESFDESEVKERTSGFELATIPQYDLFLEDTNFSSVKVEDRLRTSSLHLDEKRSLEENFPSLEITSQQDLEVFESSTFSGKRPNTVEEQEETSEKAASPKAAEMDEQIPEPESFDLKTEVMKPEDLKVLAKPNRIPPRFSKQKLKRLGFLILAIAFFGSLFFFSWNHFSKRMAGLQTFNQISISFSGEATPAEQRDFFSDLNDEKSTHALKQIEHLFNQAYRQYSNDQQDVVRIFSHAPIISSRTLSIESLSFIQNQDLEQLLPSLGLAEKKAADSNLFFYLFPAQSLGSRSSFPEYTRSGLKHLSFLSVDSKDRFESIFRIARAIAFQYGATDRSSEVLNDENKNTLLAEALKSPVFPQTKAELSAARIFITATESRRPTSISEIVIGPQTAYELGWISENRKNNLIGND